MDSAKKTQDRFTRLRAELSELKKHLADINPYEHPKWVYPWRCYEVARKYFAWELMHGTDVEKLKKDPYWKYYEQNETTETPENAPGRRAE